MTREWSTKIVNFMTPWGGVLVLRRGHRNHLSEYALSSTLSICSTLIAILLRDNDAAFLCHCWFLFILQWACWYMSHLTRSPGRVTDTQVTVQAHGSLARFLSDLTFANGCTVEHFGGSLQCCWLSDSYIPCVFLVLVLFQMKCWYFRVSIRVLSHTYRR